MDNSYKKIAEHYSQTFEKHGATPQGLDWDNEHDMRVRYRTMYELIKPSLDIPSILDFGCGYGGFYNYLIEARLLKQNQHFNYTGIDINSNLINKAIQIHPLGDFKLRDIHNENQFLSVKNHDWTICNGTFTVKGDLTQKEMTNFFCSTIEKLWTKTNKGIAFNCMSKVLDYERSDLFHVSFDELSMWVYDNLSSKFTIRQDYSLREFTMYVYK